ncbi:MAG: metallophosphoesterase [Ketobacteraceae bacterium]|nr:metallophosphoesterase [Ketobacteraceae bacterium]
MAALQRLHVMSDIHIDYLENRELVSALSASEYQQDTLILAGDVTDDLALLETCLAGLVGCFRHLVFVPGNHELWVKRSDHRDSLEKFRDILALCESLGVVTEPLKIGGKQAVWIVPLFSWYHTSEHPEDSLYLDKKAPRDKTFDMWSDFFITQWPESVKDDICRYFLEQNQPRLSRHYDAPVVSVTHFLPRQELMLSTPEERENSELTFRDLHPEFNFSQVAGSWGIDRQVRQLESRVHVYGHQHRNRCRQIEGITYLSHSMGYPRERKLGLVSQACTTPLQIWSDANGFLV